MRHGAVSYFDDDGRPVPEDDVPLTAEGREQVLAARALLEDVELDRVIVSGLPRTRETATLVAPGHEVEVWPELREIKGARLETIPEAELEDAFIRAWHGVVPEEKRFLGGESVGELFDRVIPAVDRLAADTTWDTALIIAHGGVNRAILSYALTRERVLLGRFEQAAGCVNVLDVDEHGEWIVRAVNVAPSDLVHRSTRQTTMELYWAQYRAAPQEPPDTGSGATI